MWGQLTQKHRQLSNQEQHKMLRIMELVCRCCCRLVTGVGGVINNRPPRRSATRPACGLLLTTFANSTLASYLNPLELISLTFPFAPFERLPVLPVLPAPALAALRWALVGCGAGLAAGVAPRPSLLAAAPLLAYFTVHTARPCTLYNNHCAPRASRRRQRCPNA